MSTHGRTNSDGPASPHDPSGSLEPAGRAGHDNRESRSLLFGNPIIDHYAQIDEETEERVRSLLPGYRRGEAQHVDPDLMDELLHMVRPEARFVSGGALTTASLLARLGASVAFAGSVGNDGEAAEVREALAARRIDSLVSSCSPQAEGPGSERTGRSLYLRHPANRPGKPAGGEAGNAELDDTGGAPLESIFVSPSAALSMERLPEELQEESRNGRLPRSMYLEGFLLPRRRLIEEIAGLCGESGAELILDLGNAAIVQAFRTGSLAAILPFTKLLFGTEEECAALIPEHAGLPAQQERTGREGPELFRPQGPFHALLRRHGIPAAVVKRGASELLIFEGERRTTIPTFPPPEILRDATGAGDILAGGSIFALGEGYGLTDAVSYGAYVAALSLGGWGASRILDPETLIEKPEQILHTG
jgi:sugar/nucleoside kinase (ribokinase family)